MSFSHLATIGTLSYNGYTFDGASQISVSANFVMDEAERTVLYHEYTITVRGFVSASSQGTGTDPDLESIRARLSKAGQALRFINKGFGDDLKVNITSSGGLRDVKFGPMPRMLSWEPVGSNQACEIEWQVTTCVPKCGTESSGRSTGIMSINYAVSYAIDKGFTERTISGHLIIAQTRRGNQAPDCADLYRRYITPQAPDGYERKHTWDVSLDKSRIDFTITDTQIRSKNPYPQGVVDIEAKHRVNWSPRHGGFIKLSNNLSVDIELAPGVSPARGWLIFGQILQQRIAGPLSRRQAFLESLEVEEDIFGYRSSYSCNYRILCGVEDLIGTSGLFKPLTGTNWRLWRTSLPQQFDNHGISGLVQHPSNDAIIDLCTSGQTINWNAQAPVRPAREQSQRSTFKNQKPDKKKSYIHYEMQVQASRTRPVVRQSPMQEPDQMNDSSDMSASGARFEASGDTEDTIQESGPSRYFVSLIGTAVRVGWPIPKPGIIKAGTQQPIEVSTVFTPVTLGNYFGQLVYKATFAITYMLKGSPQTIEPPCNLASCEDNCTRVQP
jgi:hypothetical protein